jgi:EAL domain-containing protein (putative c-di-GMP-specific phosphodiesterase class I)
MATACSVQPRRQGRRSRSNAPTLIESCGGFGDDRSYISFNLSARQLTTEIPQTVAYRLDQYGVDPSQLSVEITKQVRASQPRSSAILRVAVEMGNVLGLGVMAGGIENAEQRDMLQSLECTIGQGYFFARPGAIAG